MERQGGGVILTTASTAGLRPRPGLTWYNASKGWAITATKSMAVELAPKNIRVNCLCPVAGETGMLEKFMGEDTPEKRAQVPRLDPARPAFDAARHRQCGAVAGLGRGRIHHRRGAGGGWRPLHLTNAPIRRRSLNLRNLFDAASFGANWRLSLSDRDKREALGQRLVPAGQRDAEGQIRTGLPGAATALRVPGRNLLMLRARLAIPIIAVVCISAAALLFPAATRTAWQKVG